MYYYCENCNKTYDSSEVEHVIGRHWLTDKRCKKCGKFIEYAKIDRGSYYEVFHGGKCWRCGKIKHDGKIDAEGDFLCRDCELSIRLGY